jgi:hypothetical protein
MALAVILDWANLVWDISTGYLHSDRSKCIRLALRLAKGFRRIDEDGEELLACLESICYGAPNGGHAFQQTLMAWVTETFSQDGWSTRESMVDEAICFIVADQHALAGISPELAAAFPSGVFSVIITYVDDIDAYGPSEAVLQVIMEKYNKRFGVKQGDRRFMLGVVRDWTVNEDGTRRLHLSMPEFISDLADEYREWLPVKAPNTPWPPDLIIGTKQDDYKPSTAEQTKYREMGYARLAGSMLWLGRQAHPEISFAASQIASVMSMPSEIAWKAALGTLRWVMDHANHGIVFDSGYSEVITSRNRTHTLTARDLHAHADSGHDTYDDSRAHGGHAVYLAGGPVAHSSKKLAIVTDSTLYSEYVQLHACGREVETIWNFLQELGEITDFLTQQPVSVFCDNDNATGTAMGTKRNTASRHIAVKFHYTKQLVKQGTIEVHRVPTTDNRADLFTKPVKGPVFKRLIGPLKGRL